MLFLQLHFVEVYLVLCIQILYLFITVSCQHFVFPCIVHSDSLYLNFVLILQFFKPVNYDFNLVIFLVKKETLFISGCFINYEGPMFITS